MTGALVGIAAMMGRVTILFMNALRDVRAGGAITAGSTTSAPLSLRRMAGGLIAGIEAAFSAVGRS
jgi:hypothetical protein